MTTTATGISLVAKVIDPVDVGRLTPQDHAPSLNKPKVNGGLFYRITKRCFDVVAALTSIVFLSLLMLIVAFMIRIDSRGPIIFKQVRVGLDGKKFILYKFRSMRVGAEQYGIRWAAKDDQRITRVGAFLRKSRLDELPQMWNILKGEMSLVGPRPERPEFCDLFETGIPGWAYRTTVPPGLTGLAQVNGGYDLLPRDKLVLDLRYIETRSIMGDFSIMLKTIGVMFFGKGAR